jgi:hypothetical protein
MDKVMSRMKRVEEYADPSHSEWRGQSTSENISRWEKRAGAESKLAPRAKGGSTELPTTGPVKLHETHVRSGDARAEAKADLNHKMGSGLDATLREYGIKRGIRRES